jgi:hypothetical protein
MRQFDKDWKLLRPTRRWLSMRGYKLVETRGPDALDQALGRYGLDVQTAAFVGDQYRIGDQYAGDHVALAIVAWGGHWFVQVKTAQDRSDWYTLKSWSACLGAPASFYDPRLMTNDESEQTPSDLASQLDYLREHLTEIEAACQPDRVEATLKCVSAADFEAKVSWLLKIPLFSAPSPP